MDYNSYYYTIKKMDNSIIESLISHEKGVNFVTTLAIQALHKYKTKKNKKLTYHDLVIRMNYWRKKNEWLKALHRNPLNCALHYSMSMYNRNPKLIEREQFKKNRLPIRFYEHINIVNNKVDIPITEMFFDVLPLTWAPRKYQEIKNITISLDDSTYKDEMVLSVYGMGK